MPNCKYNDKGHLFFDFAIFKEGKLHCLIEYNGKQHYDSIAYWGGDEGLRIRQERDLVKYEYCKNNNISLIIYSYLDKIEENAEENRKIQIVKSAISTLSFSELEAITHIFEELEGNEGILVASKIADRVGITRSVIVNALRKFESAGVIESRSSGMKGTYIKVLNDVVFDELEKVKNH